MMLPPALRRFMRSIWVWVCALPFVAWLAIAVAMWLSGCAIFDAPAENFDWYRVRPPATKPYARLYLMPEDVGFACKMLGGDGLERGCTSHAKRLIVLPIDSPAWYLAHELRHQDGEDHP